MSIREPLSIVPMTAAHATNIGGWRYAAPYAVYDSDAHTADLMLDPANNYHAVVDASGSLVAFCCFGREAQVPGGDYSDDALDIGVGMHPLLTGQGRGRDLIGAVAEHAELVLGARRLRATIAAWNQRSIQAATAAGFRRAGTFRQAAGAGGRTFTVLLREPPA